MSAFPSVLLQRFLATINSTVIDWFQPWPEVSLLSVARKFLDEVDLVSDTVRNAVVEFMPFSSAAVNNVSDRLAAGDMRAHALLLRANHHYHA